MTKLMKKVEIIEKLKEIDESFLDCYNTLTVKESHPRFFAANYILSVYFRYEELEQEMNKLKHYQEKALVDLKYKYKQEINNFLNELIECKRNNIKEIK